jgi:DNA polymerase elongation subunit (family B)
MVSIVKGKSITKDNKNFLTLKIRAGNELKFLDVPFNNYLYIQEKDFSEENFNLFSKYFSKYEKIQKSNGVFYKFYLVNNYKQNFAKEALENIGIECFEADINPFKRWLIDNQQIELNTKEYKKVWLDIETFDLGSLNKDFSGRVIGDKPIMSIAFEDFETEEITFFENEAREKLKITIEDFRKTPEIQNKVYNELCKNEKNLLVKIYNFLKNYDLCSAYNGSAFDFTFIQQRMNLYEIDYQDLMINDIDYMEMYMKNVGENLDSYSLENVSKHEFFEEINKENSRFNNLSEVTKVDWKKITNCKKYVELYLFEPKIFKEYNIQDVRLMHLIESKLHLFKIHDIISKLSRCPIGQTLHNSYSCDYLMLNEYKKLNIIKNSKPSKQIIEERKDPTRGQFPPGGFTYAYLLGLHNKVECFDFKSQYPTNIITYNISPDTYVKTISPDLTDLKKIFSDDELKLLQFSIDIKKDYTNVKGELKKISYDNAINNYQIELGLEKNILELMWKFIDEYKPIAIKKLIGKDNIFTPADFNYDTRGWTLHPHFIFKKEEGVAPKIMKKLLIERDKVKYSMKKFKEKSPEWYEANWYQLAIKTIANSLYGYFAFKSGREFQYEIPTAITTSSRFTTKKCVLFAKKNGYESTHGDTDSAYLKNVENKYSIDELEELFFDYFKELVKPYNTSCEIELFNPRKLNEIKKIKTLINDFKDAIESINNSDVNIKNKNQIIINLSYVIDNEEKKLNNINPVEICNHFVVFEHEKTLESLIVVKKKRYYFKEEVEGEMKYKTQGGAHKKSDTIKIASEYQKELCKDILDFNFDKQAWKIKIEKLLIKTKNFELEPEYLIKKSAISRPVEEYGKPVIDGKTGKQKLRKSDNEPMFSPIPAHIKIAKKLIEEGHEINVGDKIEYIVAKNSPIEPITIEEFNIIKKYDFDYYWERISSVLIEILSAVYPEDVYTFFSSCWGYNEKKLKRLVDKLKVDEDE